MIIKLNTTGTHIHKGLLKLRADLYPTVTDKTYALQHVYVPVIPEGATDEQLNDKAWIDALPHLWQLNPAQPVRPRYLGNAGQLPGSTEQYTLHLAVHEGETTSYRVQGQDSRLG